MNAFLSIQEVVIPIAVNLPDGIRGADFILRYDQRVWNTPTAEPGPNHPIGSGAAYASVVATSDEFSDAKVGVAREWDEPWQGDLILVKFTRRTDAPLGQTRIEIVERDLTDTYPTQVFKSDFSPYTVETLDAREFVI